MTIAPLTTRTARPLKKVGLALAVGSLILGGCSKADPCEGFNKTFDDLQAKVTSTAGAVLQKGGICHTRVEKDRKAKCPEYYTWLAAATSYANFVASDKSTCTNEVDRKNAVADLKALAKPGAFPQR